MNPIKTLLLRAGAAAVLAFAACTLAYAQVPTGGGLQIARFPTFDVVLFQTVCLDDANYPVVGMRQMAAVSDRGSIVGCWMRKGAEILVEYESGFRDAYPVTSFRKVPPK
jgi:hypothetical protein